MDQAVSGTVLTTLSDIVTYLVGALMIIGSIAFVTLRLQRLKKKAERRAGR